MLNFNIVSLTKILLCSQFFLSFSNTVYSFSLISSVNKATFAASPEYPSITFYWDGSSPELTEVDELGVEEWTTLNSEELMEELLLYAFNKWNETPGSYINLVLERDSSVVQDREDKINSIVISKQNNLSSSAFALPIIEKQTIVDCDISLSSKSTKAKTLAYTIMHEVGHCLGLGHAHTNAAAIMSYSREDQTLKLGADDIAGLIYLYPHPDYQTDHKEFLACSSLTPNSDQQELQMSLLFLWFLPLILVFTRN